MKSQRGFVAALVILLALPLTVLYQMLFSNGGATVIHLLLATGSLLLAWAVFDFGKVATRLSSPKSKWITWLGCLGAGVEGTIFLLQGLSHLIQNAAFTELVYQRLGQWPERLCMDLIIVWLIALWFSDSQGKSRLVGLVTLVSVIGLEVYSYYLSYLNSSINIAAPGLKLLYLLPFVWLLLESIKQVSSVNSLKSLIPQKETL